MPFLDFVVDGKSLGHRLGGEVTALTVDQPDFRTENLLRLDGADVPLPTFEPQFRRSRIDRLLGRRGAPVACHESAFGDGRICLYYCRCGDIDCGVLSTRLEVGETTVTWHDVGWQVGYEPFDEEKDALATFVFDRSAYEQLLRDLLGADWSDLPVL